MWCLYPFSNEHPISLFEWKRRGSLTMNLRQLCLGSANRRHSSTQDETFLRPLGFFNIIPSTDFKMFKPSAIAWRRISIPRQHGRITLSDDWNRRSSIHYDIRNTPSWSLLICQKDVWTFGIFMLMNSHIQWHQDAICLHSFSVVRGRNYACIIQISRCR